MAGVTPQQLGRSGITVSNLALGSWRTCERIPREAGMAVMRAAMEAGIDFLDEPQLRGGVTDSDPDGSA